MHPYALLSCMSAPVDCCKVAACCQVVEASFWRCEGAEPADKQAAAYSYHNEGQEERS